MLALLQPITALQLNCFSDGLQVHYKRVARHYWQPYPMDSGALLGAYLQAGSGKALSQEMYLLSPLLRAD
jgi:hypothetical protein